MTMTRRSAALLALFFCFSAPAWAGGHEQAEASDERRATVAGGGEVTLAASSKTDAQWADARPDYRDLRPEKR